MYLRHLVAGLAAQPVALVGIDCKRGVELAPFAPRLSALATDPDEAAELLPVLVKDMEDRYDLIKARQGIAPGTPDEEITSDVWGLPDSERPFPVVLFVDEVAELFLVATRKDEERRDEMVTHLIRLAQLGRHLPGGVRAALRRRTGQGRDHVPGPSHRPRLPPRQRRSLRQDGARRHRARSGRCCLLHRPRTSSATPPAAGPASAPRTCPSPTLRPPAGNRRTSPRKYRRLRPYRVWQEARLLALPPAVAASPLASRPYDLRHSALSTWLNAGVDPTEVAERAGNSVEVLLTR